MITQTLKLSFTPPYDWERLYGFITERALPGVEFAENNMIRRALRLERGAVGVIEIHPLLTENAISATITVPDQAALPSVTDTVRRVFDLDSNPAQIAAHLSKDPILKPLTERYPGLRIPGAWDVFEYAVRAILGQQISVKSARTLARRVVETYGEPLDPEHVTPGVSRLFPPPDVLIDANLVSLGVTKARAGAINALAATVMERPRLFQDYANLDEIVTRLIALRGVGMWTAQYLAMRALHESDAFPEKDLGIVRSYGRLAGEVTAKEFLKIADTWRPYRAYAAMLIWQEY